jgi:hypothetical protein
MARFLQFFLQATIKFIATVNYNGYNYGENMINDYHLKLCVSIDVDDLFVTGRS